MDEFIDRGLKLYDAEKLAWKDGDVLGIATSKQSQPDTHIGMSNFTER